MKIYSILLIKDEEDVVAASISKMLEWADMVFVIDNASSDNTVKIVNSLNDKRIEFIGSISVPYMEGLRGVGFNLLMSRKNFQTPSWWCMADVDEVYVDDPRRFLSNIHPKYGRVCTKATEFIGLIDEEKPLNPGSYRQYIPIEWSESRFFRHTSAVEWSNYAEGWPRNCRAAYPTQIRVLHFPFRCSKQIERRIEIRNLNRQITGIPWSNSKYRNAAELLANYRIERRRESGGEYEFLDHSSNFLADRKARFKNALKMAMYHARLL